MNVPELLLEISIVVLAVVSCLTNFSVLLCFTQSGELRSHVPGLFILNLSLSNILLTLVNMPATFLGVATGAEPFGEPLCRAVSSAETFATCNAMLSMAALSVDRWLAVVFPLRYSGRMRYRDALLIVAYCWLHSLAFSLTQLTLGWGAYSHAYASCTAHLGAGNGSQVLAYAAPLLQLRALPAGAELRLPEGLEGGPVPLPEDRRDHRADAAAAGRHSPQVCRQSEARRGSAAAGLRAASNP